MGDMRFRLVSPHAALARRAGDRALDWVVRLHTYTHDPVAHGMFSDLFWFFYEGGLWRDVAHPDRPHTPVLVALDGNEVVRDVARITRANLMAAVLAAQQSLSAFEDEQQRQREEEQQEEQQEQGQGVAQNDQPQQRQRHGDFRDWEQNLQEALEKSLLQPSRQHPRTQQRQGDDGNSRQGQQQQAQEARKQDGKQASNVAAAIAQAVGRSRAALQGIAEAWRQLPGETPEAMAMQDGWGDEAPTFAEIDPRQVSSSMTGYGHIAKVLARLGRAEGAIERARQSVKNVGVVGKVGLTGNLMRAFPSEVGLLSSNVPALVRARQLQKFAGHRALGMDWGEAKERGALAVVLDESGSMNKGFGGATRLIAAKSLAAAVMTAAMNEGREVFYLGFASQAAQRFIPVRDKATMFKAIASFMNGGTSIVAALNALRERIAETVQDEDVRESLDILLITDANESIPEWAVEEMWKQMRVEMPSVRLRMVFLGNSYNPDTVQAFDALPGARAVALPDAAASEEAIAEFAAEILEIDDEEVESVSVQ